MEDPKHTSVRVGEVLAGKYRVDGVLGVGGMGVVVAAHHLQLDERVALKFLLPEALGNEEAVMRFEQEARAAVKITSEHVARVIDVGALESGAPYIVMELLEGSDLSAWIREKGPLPVEQAVEFVLHACEAIAEAHSLGIVHRDLKPANLFVVRRKDGLHSVKVLDFGISKVRKNGLGDMGGTKTSVIMGSPFYMSPEQMRASKDVDPQSDIWALGVILYEALTGRTPFEAETYAETCVRVMTEAPRSLCELRPDVPPALAAAIEKCLAKDRARRHADVAEFALSLQEFSPRRAKVSIERIHGVLGRDRVSAIAAPVVPSHNPVATMSPFGRTTGAVRAMKKSSWVVNAAGAAILLCATAAGAFGLGVFRSGGFSVHASTAAMVPWVPTPSRAAEAPSPDPLPERVVDRAAPITSVAGTTPVAPVVGAPIAAVTVAAVTVAAAGPVAAESAPLPSEPPPQERAEAHNERSDPSGSAPVQRHAFMRRVAASHSTPSPFFVVPPSSSSSESEAASHASIAAAIPTAPQGMATDCETPFYFDASGTRIFKKECVH